MQNKMPLVSIIMPAYNAEKFIYKSILSVINQTYHNWELIVVNDGSIDNTFEIVNAIKDIRIRLINIKNSGVACARNVGIKKVKGDYIAFLDSDDYWYFNKLEIQLRYMLLNSGIDLSYTDYSTINEDDIFVKNKQLYPFKINNPNDRLLVFNYIATLTVMVKTSIVFELSGFDEAFFGTEDWDFWIRISSKGNLAYIDDRLACYRENLEGISKNKKKHLIQEYKVLKKYVLNSENKKLKNSALWFLYSKFTNYYFSSNEFKRAFKCYFIMIKKMPFKIENFTFPLRRLFLS